MHILIGLLSLITVIGGIVFWVRMITNTARKAVELPDDIRAAFRRFGFSAKAKANPLDAVDDPRIAATGIFIALACMDGPLSREQNDGIREESARLFSTTEQEAADLTAIGQWLAREHAPEDAIRRLTRSLVGRLTTVETQAFIKSATKIAAIQGRVDVMQRDAIELLSRDLR